MKTWPEFNDNGDLPPGIHKSTLSDVIVYFGKGSLKRTIVAARLERIFNLAIGTGRACIPVHYFRFLCYKQESSGGH